MKKYYSFFYEKVVRWLNAEEIEHSPGLQILSWCLLVSSVVFLFWSNIVVGSHIFNTNCWPFWQSCHSLQNIIFLNSYIELRSVQFSLFLGIVCYSAYSLLKRRYTHYLLSFSLLSLFRSKTAGFSLSLKDVMMVILWSSTGKIRTRSST